MTFEYDNNDIERFMAKVEKLRSGCWFWTGARSRGKGNKKWYGSFTVKGKRIRAHRFACEAIGGQGPLPKGFHRDHECCFSLCVNPKHITYVTHSKNQELKLERQKKVLSNGTKNLRRIKLAELQARKSCKASP